MCILVRIEGKGSTMFVHVSCFSSDSSAKVQWFSTDITEDTPPVPVVSTPDNDVLVVDLFNLSATNLIDYHCIANNSFGAARTVPFRAYRPPRMYLYGSYSVEMGFIALFWCADAGAPQNVFQFTISIIL